MPPELLPLVKAGRPPACGSSGAGMHLHICIGYRERDTQHGNPTTTALPSYLDRSTTFFSTKGAKQRQLSDIPPQILISSME